MCKNVLVFHFLYYYVEKNGIHDNEKLVNNLYHVYLTCKRPYLPSTHRPELLTRSSDLRLIRCVSLHRYGFNSFFHHKGLLPHFYSNANVVL